jgi:hypothetical protein
MLRSLVGATALVVLAPITPASAATASAQGDTVSLVMSNFRFCRTAPCLPTDQGYVRNPTGGAVPGTDNPAAIVDVPAGATVVWTYEDSFCDAFEMCPGHMVMIDDGSAGGRKVGMAEARKGPTTVTYRVTEPPGTLIHYFCNVNSHDQLGQTGVLRVV